MLHDEFYWLKAGVFRADSDSPLVDERPYLSDHTFDPFSLSLSTSVISTSSIASPLSSSVTLFFSRSQI